MKTSLIILSFLVFLQAVNAQKMPSDYFQEAGKFYEKEEYDKAFVAYQYIVDNHPNNKLYPMAFFNTGFIYFIQKQYDKAMPVFRTILNSRFNEKDPVGNGIMDDPYANYKHRASEIMSDIYYKRNAYDSALYYFTLSDSAYPYLHFCGNEYDAYHVHAALKFADLYEKLEQPQKAIAKLLHVVLIESADNKVFDELRTLLKNETYLKGKLDKALQEIYVKEYKMDGKRYEDHYFRFLDTEIRLADEYEIEENPFDKGKAIKIIMKTRFYKMIATL